MTDREGRRLRALAVPTRRRLLDLVRQAPAGSTVSELTAATGLHPNTVRLHLEVLARAGLVEGVPASVRAPASGRGRPPARYVAVAEADDAAAVSGPSATLATWLATAVEPAQARAAGRRIGRSMVEGSGASSGLERLVALLDGEGFSPRVAYERDVVVLDRCPFAGAGGSVAGAVCELHRGVLEGAVPSARLVVGDPEFGACAVRLEAPGRP